MLRTLAIIPARGGSKRLPGKNLMPLNGVSLVARAVRFAVSAGLFDEVVISSDSPEILATALAEGAVAQGLRPADLASDTASSVDVMLYELSMAERRSGRFDLVALLQPTTPYRRLERWQAALDILRGSPTVPSVIGVSPTASLPWHLFSTGDDGALKPLFPHMLTRRSQDLPHVLEVNGSLYLVRRDVLCDTHRLFFDTSRGVVFDRAEECIDIDTYEDFRAAETLLARLEGQQ